MFYYILFGKTGYEQKIVNEINKHWRFDGLKPFIPMYDARFRKAGKVCLEKRRLCPGYVFIESEISGTEFYLAAYPYIVRSENAFKLLRYGLGHDNLSFEMNAKEYLAFMSLYNEEYCVEMSKGLIVNDLVKITDGPLQGFESKIKKINRHKLEAVVEMEIMGRLTDVRVGLEVIEKL
ncbi:MAG: antiterminator LoaP [Lachnospiraceae bacterium]|nr:antiterminator LoaP [Lachnospiraceae bacterium]